MKRIFIIGIILLCIVPLASALNCPTPPITNPIYSNTTIADTTAYQAYTANPAGQFNYTNTGSVTVNFTNPYSTIGTGICSGLGTAYYMEWDAFALNMDGTLSELTAPRDNTFGKYFTMTFAFYSDMPYQVIPVPVCGSNYWDHNVMKYYYNPLGASLGGYCNYTPSKPYANFTASQTNAIAPAYIAFTDTSTNETGTCTYNWTYTPDTGVLVAPTDLDNQDITMLFTQNGNFSITHGVSCDAGSSTKTRSDYIHITNATALSTFRVRAVDAISGYGINGASVDVFDIQNSSWQNQTSVTGEVSVSAINGHTVNAYGFATGYTDADSLNLPAVQGELYPIYMNPTTFNNNVSTGNVTLYVTLLEEGTNTRLAGYGLTLRKGHPSGGADFTSGVTNSNGVYQATVTNKTDCWVSVEAQNGHLGGTKSFNSGTQSGGDSYIEETLWLGINSVTTSPVVTTLPGGGTPTPSTTILPGCEDLTTQEGKDKCNAAQGGEMMGFLYENGLTLVELAVAAMIFGLLSMILNSFRW